MSFKFDVKKAFLYYSSQAITILNGTALKKQGSGKVALRSLFSVFVRKSRISNHVLTTHHNSFQGDELTIARGYPKFTTRLTKQNVLPLP